MSASDPSDLHSNCADSLVSDISADGRVVVGFVLISGVIVPLFHGGYVTD